MVLLEKAAVAHQEAKSDWRIVADVHQGGVDPLPFLMDLPVDFRGAEGSVSPPGFPAGRAGRENAGGSQLLGHKADIFRWTGSCGQECWHSPPADRYR